VILEDKPGAMPAVVSGAPKDHRPFGGRQQLGNDPEERGLSTATRADDAHKLAHSRGQCYPVDCTHRTTAIHERVRYAVAVKLEVCHPLQRSPWNGEYASAHTAPTGGKLHQAHTQ
jgi:hypothetical protein